MSLYGLLIPVLLSGSTGVPATPPETGYRTALGEVGGVRVLRIDPDDDGAGHSVWPKYLVGQTAARKTLWQFPRRLLYPGMGQSSEAELRAHFETIDLACLVPTQKTVIAFGRKQYGLRARDGRILWRRARPEIHVLSLQPFESGCFALVTPRGQPGVYHQPGPENHSSLAFIEARTGRWRWLRRVPVANRLALEQGELRLYADERRIAALDPAAVLKAGPESAR